MPSDPPPLVEAEGLVKHFVIAPSRAGAGGLLRAVDGVTLRIGEGETLGVVGESGCGKSTLGRLIVGLLEPTAGAVRVRGADIFARGGAAKSARGLLQMVFQNPAGSMNPRRSVRASVAEPLHARGIGETRDAVARMLTLVGLDPRMADRLPHEMSGGQQQRASIARALIAEPALVVHDESIASLDISLQAQILNLLLDLQDRLGASYLFISHDLAAVQTISHRITVMYLGEMVETAPTAEFARRPLHPYSVALRRAALTPDPVVERNRPDLVLRGDVPSPLDPPSGCRFRTRCPIAAPRCAGEKPALREIAARHAVACHFPGESEVLARRVLRAGEAKAAAP